MSVRLAEFLLLWSIAGAIGVAEVRPQLENKSLVVELPLPWLKIEDSKARRARLEENSSGRKLCWAGVLTGIRKGGS